MRRFLIVAVVTALTLAAAPAALARTQTAHAGAVSATFSFSGQYPDYSGLHLTISRAGAVAYSAPVSAPVCGHQCAPGAVGRHASSVHLIDLDATGERNVVLDLYTGGAHCCFIEQVFSFDAARSTYTRAQHDFGDPGARIVDLGHDGRYEFLTADDAFAYEFTDFATSGLPIQVLSFTGGRFDNVTDSYPALIDRDAAIWLRAFKHMARGHYADSVGVIAAWVADEYRLGRQAQADRYLRAQARAGHLNSVLEGAKGSGMRFVAGLDRFLRRLGYLR
ncbi:MAG: hypothetical protein ACRDM1_10985 [Gaiellaceae bacterium]